MSTCNRLAVHVQQTCCPLLEFSQTWLPVSLPCWQAWAGWTSNQKAKVDIIFSSAMVHFFTIWKFYFHANYILCSLLYTFLSCFFPNAEVSTYFYFLYVLFTYSVLSCAFPHSYIPMHHTPAAFSIYLCNGHYNRTPDLGKWRRWRNVWDLARQPILDAKVLDRNVTWLTKHKDTLWHEHKVRRHLAPLVVMGTDKASWQANDMRQERKRVVIEEDQDGDPGLRTSP